MNSVTLHSVFLSVFKIIMLFVKFSFLYLIDLALMTSKYFIKVWS